jgi:hypothetical protein
MEERHSERAATGVPADASALDRPLNSTYVRIVVLEAIIIALLWVLGRFSQ